MDKIDTSAAALRALADRTICAMRDIVETLRAVAEEKDLDDAAIASYAVTVATEKVRARVSNAEWQPFETAPKDGTWFLAWRRHGVMPIYARFVKCHGWYENDDGFHLDQATHWMPPPKGPKT